MGIKIKRDHVSTTALGGFAGGDADRKDKQIRRMLDVSRRQARDSNDRARRLTARHELKKRRENEARTARQRRTLRRRQERRDQAGQFETDRLKQKNKQAILDDKQLHEREKIEAERKEDAGRLLEQRAYDEARLKDKRAYDKELLDDERKQDEIDRENAIEDKRNQNEWEYTEKQRREREKLEQALADVEANDDYSQEEKELTRDRINAKLNGIKPVKKEVKKSPWPEGQDVGQSWTSPDGNTLLGRDKDGKIYKIGDTGQKEKQKMHLDRWKMAMELSKGEGEDGVANLKRAKEIMKEMEMGEEAPAEEASVEAPVEAPVEDAPAETSPVEDSTEMDRFLRNVDAQLAAQDAERTGKSKAPKIDPDVKEMMDFASQLRSGKPLDMKQMTSAGKRFKSAEAFQLWINKQRDTFKEYK